MSTVPAVTTEAQKSFTTMKSLAGEWEGPVTVPEAAADVRRQAVHVSLRVTSRGNALVHELQEAGTPLDPTKYDHPVTMLYLDGDQLTLVHYCDAGNRPRMTGKMSPDGKTVEFEFMDISGSTRRTHASFGVHHHRRQPSHRGLDLHDEGQADPRALRPAPDKLRRGISGKE